MRITATRRLQYAIGHRVMGHEGKCAHLHGHNFVFFLTAEAEPTERERQRRDFPDQCVDVLPPDDQLDSIGRVIDFGVLKEKVGGWIESRWDHGFVVFTEDRAACDAMACVKGQKWYALPWNPTAENMARYLLVHVGPARLDGTGVRLVKVTVHETENGIAEVSL